MEHVKVVNSSLRIDKFPPLDFMRRHQTNMIPFLINYNKAS